MGIRRFGLLLPPLGLITASLSFLLVVMLSCVSEKNEAPSMSSRPLYFFKADTSRFTANPQTILDKIQAAGNKTKINTDFLDFNSGNVSSRAFADFYLVGLWSYCEGEKTDGVEKITYCSSPELQFWFNPIEVWGLRNTFLQNTLGENLQKGLNTYRKIMGWMIWLFLSAAVLTAAEVVMCISAIFCSSSKRSKVISIVSFGALVLAFVAISAAASLATAAYVTLNALFNTVLQPYEIDTSVGLITLLLLWCAVVAAFTSCLLRVLLSFCCCV